MDASSKKLQRLIQKIGDVTRSSERVTSSDGSQGTYDVFRRENLSALKTLASQYSSELVDAFNETKDRETRVLLCECLQNAQGPALKPFFQKLVEENDAELRCCAMVALGKLGDVLALAKLIDQPGDKRARFFLGIGLINAGDSRGVGPLVSVLREEQSSLQYVNGYIKTSGDVGYIYSTTIDIILHGLINGEPESGDPFAWIAWWDSRKDKIDSVDPTLVPAHFLEYQPDLLAAIKPT